MPTIASPEAGLQFHRRSADADAAAPRSIALRMRVAVKREALTRELAAGADPASSPERALCAAQLISDRRRRQLARTLRHTISEARRPPLSRSRVVIIDRRGVLEAQAAIEALIERLDSPEPVAPQAMAIATRIACDAESSPLFNPVEPGTLQRQVRVATAALESGEPAIAA